MQADGKEEITARKPQEISYLQDKVSFQADRKYRFL